MTFQIGRVGNTPRLSHDPAPVATGLDHLSYRRVGLAPGFLRGVGLAAGGGVLRRRQLAVRRPSALDRKAPPEMSRIRYAFLSSSSGRQNLRVRFTVQFGAVPRHAWVDVPLESLDMHALVRAHQARLNALHEGRGDERTEDSEGLWS